MEIQELADLMNKKFDQVNSDINELKNQVGINCKKLDSMGEKIDDTQKQINQFYTAFGREISKIENHLKITPYQETI